MRSRIGRLVAAVIVAVLTLLSAPATEAIAVAPAESLSTYAYDCHHHPALVTGVFTERGPPAVHHLLTTHDAVDWSRGASARPDTATTPVAYTYDPLASRVHVDNATAPTSGHAEAIHDGLSPFQRAGVAANGADNVVNGTRLGQQLARESADSVFTSSGRLSSGAITDSRQIIPGSRLGNKDLIGRLTSDGSDIADWGKYTTRTHQSPSGDFQVHFYMNRSTGAIDYGYDYKVIFNGAR